MNQGTVCKTKVYRWLENMLPALQEEFAPEFSAVGVSGRKILEVFSGITATAQAAGKKAGVAAVAQYVSCLQDRCIDPVKLAISRHMDEKPQDPQIRHRAMRVLAPEELQATNIPLKVMVQLKCPCGAKSKVVCVAESEAKARLAAGSLCPECAAKAFKEIRKILGWEKPESEGE